MVSGNSQYSSSQIQLKKIAYQNSSKHPVVSLCRDWSDQTQSVDKSHPRETYLTFPVHKWLYLKLALFYKVTVINLPFIKLQEKGFTNSSSSCPHFSIQNLIQDRPHSDPDPEYKNRFKAELGNINLFSGDVEKKKEIQTQINNNGIEQREKKLGERGEKKEDRNILSGHVVLGSVEVEMILGMYRSWYCSAQLITLTLSTHTHTGLEVLCAVCFSRGCIPSLAVEDPSCFKGIKILTWVQQERWANKKSEWWF